MSIYYATRFGMWTFRKQFQHPGYDLTWNWQRPDFKFGDKIFVPSKTQQQSCDIVSPVQRYIVGPVTDPVTDLKEFASLLQIECVYDL